MKLDNILCFSEITDSSMAEKWFSETPTTLIMNLRKIAEKFKDDSRHVFKERCIQQCNTM